MIYVCRGTHKNDPRVARGMERRPVPALVVPKPHAEATRRRLIEAECLDHDLQPTGHDDRIAFPLRDPLEPERAAAVSVIVTDTPGATRTDVPFPVRERSPSAYQELLADLPAAVQASLPTAFDVVGDIAVVKLYDEVQPYAARIGKALLKTHKRLRTVAMDGGVKGDLRVRALHVIAGEPELTTTHREHGLRLRVPLDKVYFSPRLATERERLAGRLVSGQRVLDLFAGVGAFVCLVARDREPAAVWAIDLNPDAISALRANLDTNKLTHAPVDVIEGDARAVAPRSHDWDHVVMNLPHGAIEFLDVATDCVAPDGEIHLYAMVDQAERDAFQARLVRAVSMLMGTDWTIRETRHVRTYAPTIDGLAFTLGAAAPSP